MVAVGGQRREANPPIIFIEYERRSPQACDRAVAASRHRRASRRRLIDQQAGRPIVLPFEVLAHREPDQLPQVVFQRGIPLDLAIISTAHRMDARNSTPSGQ